MNNYNITTIHMVTKVITIGSDPACDFVINNTTMPSYSRELVERILPVHAQIFQEDNIHYLKSFGDDICINEISVFSSLFEKMILNGDIQIVNHSVVRYLLATMDGRIRIKVWHVSVLFITSI